MTGHPLLVDPCPRHRRRTVARWAAEGLRRGEQVVLVDMPLAELRAVGGLLREGGHDVDALFGGGQLRTLAGGALLEPSAAERLVLDSLDRGWSGVRIVAPADGALSGADRDRHDALEATLEELCEDYPVSVLCHFRTTREREEVAHAAGQHRTMFGLVGVVARAGGTVTLLGEFDGSNAAMLEAGLVEACRHVPAGGWLELSLPGVDFLGVAAARAVLEGTRAWRGRGGEVVLQSSSPRVTRLLDLLHLVGPGGPLHVVPPPPDA